MHHPCLGTMVDEVLRTHARDALVETSPASEVASSHSDTKAALGYRAETVDSAGVAT